MLLNGKRKYLLYTKYPTLLELETRHGMLAYSTPALHSLLQATLCAAFVDKLSMQSRPFSVSMGGMTDAGKLEDELVVIT